MITFDIEPARYRHWRLSWDGPIAILTLDVAEEGGLSPGYRLKLNSYDLGVDIELHDALNRIRFEHPEVRVVILTSGRERVFCSGATSTCWARRAMQRKSISANSPTRRATASRIRAPIRSSNSSRRSTAPAPVAATSWLSPATRSLWSTTGRARSACRKSRCSACCPVPVG